MKLALAPDPMRKIILDKIENAEGYIRYHTEQLAVEEDNLAAAQKLLAVYDQAAKELRK